MGRPSLRIQHAAQVAPHIPTAASGDWRLGRDIAAASGLTLPQVQRAVKFIRTLVPDDSLVGKSGLGYRFTTDRAEVNAYKEKNFKDTITTFEVTFKGAMLPYLRQQAPAHIPWIEHQMNSLVSSIRIAMGSAP